MIKADLIRSDVVVDWYHWVQIVREEHSFWWKEAKQRDRLAKPYRDGCSRDGIAEDASRTNSEKGGDQQKMQMHNMSSGPFVSLKMVSYHHPKGSDISDHFFVPFHDIGITDQ